MLDELEEWQLLLDHYCILLAVCDRACGGLSLTEDPPSTDQKSGLLADTAPSGSRVFSEMSLQRSVTWPLLASVGQGPTAGFVSGCGGGNAGGDVEYSDNYEGVTRRVMGSMLRAQHPVPLGGALVEEEEEGEEEEEDGEGRGALEGLSAAATAAAAEDTEVMAAADVS